MPKSLPITLLNAHADDFTKTPVSFWFARRRGLGKYAYLIDEQSSGGRPVDVLVDGTVSSLFGQSWFAALPRWMRYLVLRIEVAFWQRINDLSGKVIVHWSPDTIVDRSVLYVFSYKNCAGAFEKRRTDIERFRIKLINLSHYFIRTKEKAANIATLTNVILTAESDLRHNSYFNRFFPAPLPFLILPFAINPRFTMKIPLAQRKGICAATGSFHNLRNEEPASYYRDYMEFFKLDTYHTVRKLLFEHRAELKDWLDSRVSKYREKDKEGRGLRIFQTSGRLDVAQSEYFSFNMVDFYNNHQFAIVGEEASGSPTIGFFEAMACCCIMLGQQGSFYDGLGLEPNVHYLPHAGTIESIRRVIDDVSADPARKNRVSEAGLDYVAKHCSPAAVWRDLQIKLVDAAASLSPVR